MKLQVPPYKLSKVLSLAGSSCVTFVAVKLLQD